MEDLGECEIVMDPWQGMESVDVVHGSLYALSSLLCKKDFGGILVMDRWRVIDGRICNGRHCNAVVQSVCIVITALLRKQKVSKM